MIKQTIGLEHLEIILANDASTDATLDNLMEWDQRFPENIMVITYEENLCQGGARNVGFSCESGDFIGFVDSDDWMYDYREKQKFIQTIPNAEMLLIDEEDVDGEIFKDTNHGVGLDYIKFLNLYIPVIDEQMEVCNELIINDVVNIGEDICISYRNNRPEIEYIRFK